MNDGRHLVPKAAMEALRIEFPFVRVEEKVRWRRLGPLRYPSRWLLMHWFVCFITLGRNRDFLTKFITTAGSVIGVPEGWKSPDLSKGHTMAHERVHLRQIEICGKVLLVGFVWRRGGFALGSVLFSFLFLFALPFLVTFRYRFERPAYKVSIRLRLRDRGEDEARALVTHVIELLSSSAYGWAATRKRASRDFEEFWEVLNGAG